MTNKITAKSLEDVEGNRLYSKSMDHVLEVTLPSGAKTKILIPKNLEKEYPIGDMTFGLNLVTEGHYD